MIEWRYGDQLEWRLVLVGLSEDVSRYLAHGYTPIRQALGQLRFRERYGMPFSGTVKSGLSPSSRACRAVIAARRQWPGAEWRVFRALQLANFNSALRFDDDDQVREVLDGVPGVDAEQIVGLVDSPEVTEEYEADKALTRTAAGSPTEFQGKAGNSDGAVRYTAPSVIFETGDGRRLVNSGRCPRLDSAGASATPPRTYPACDGCRSCDCSCSARSCCWRAATSSGWSLVSAGASSS